MDINLHNHHQCSIVSEDVLRTDISGRGAIAGLRRCWHDLFLMSYGNQDTKLFYSGSVAMRRERLRHFRSYKYVIHPWSKFRKVWTYIVALSVVFNIFSFTQTTSPLFANEISAFLPIVVPFELIVLIDIAMHFNMGYVDEATKIVILDRKKILLHYMCTGIFLHGVTAIPLQVILIMSSLGSGESEICMSSPFVCILRILSAIRTVRLWEMLDCWKLVQRQTPVSPPWYIKVLKTFILTIGTMIQVSCLGDSMTLLEANDIGFLHPESFLAFMLIQKHVMNVTSYQLFFLDTARLFKKFVISSQGFYLNRRPIDRLTAVTNYFLGASFFTWCLLEIATHLHRSNYTSNQKKSSMEETVRFIQSRQIEDTLKDRISNYYSYIGSHNVWKPTRNKMFTTLPKSIRDEMTVETRRHLLSDIELFCDFPPSLLDKITLLLNLQIYLEGDTVMNALFPYECMMIVVRGILARYSPEGEELGQLIDGDVLWEQRLVTDEGGTVTRVRVVAITDCCVAFLHSNDFRTVMASHSSLFNTFKNKLAFQNFP